MQEFKKAFKESFNEAVRPQLLALIAEGEIAISDGTLNAYAYSLLRSLKQRLYAIGSNDGPSTVSRPKTRT